MRSRAKRRSLYRFESVALPSVKFPAHVEIDTPSGKQIVYARSRGQLEHIKAVLSMRAKLQYSEAELDAFFAGLDREAMAKMVRESAGATS